MSLQSSCAPISQKQPTNPFGPMPSVDSVVSSTSSSSSLEDSTKPRTDAGVASAAPSAGTALKSNINRSLFASPTDNLMSPCSAKLQTHKYKFLMRPKKTGMPGGASSSSSNNNSNNAFGTMSAGNNRPVRAGSSLRSETTVLSHDDGASTN